MSIWDRRGPLSHGGSVRAPVVALLVLLLGTTALAGPWGVPLGRRNVKAEITPGGDVDSYLVEAHAGALLDVKLVVAKGSQLRPDVELIGPDGSVLDAPFDASRRALRLRRFGVVDSGLHEIRIGGIADTSGAYSVSAKVKGSAKVNVKGLRLGAGDVRAFEFAAGAGAIVDFSVRSKPSAATFVRLESPAGASVPIPSDSVRADAGGRLKGKRIPLPASGTFGTWRLVVRADAGVLGRVRTRITARGGRLSAVRGRLPALEPVLGAVAPGEAGAGTALDSTGQGFSSTKKHPLRVFVAGVEASGVVLTSATRLRFTMPAGLTGPVDVGLQNGDGHAAVLRGELVAIPPPRVTSFEPSSGPADGGTLVLVHGSAFRAGAAVTLAGTAFQENTEFVDETLLRFTTPSFASGDQTIGVRDPTGQDAVAATPFDFVAAPVVLAVRPPLVPNLPNQTTALTGGGFSDTQTVTIGGLPAASVTLDGVNRMVVELPVLPVGAHDIEVRDPLGQTSTVTDGLAIFTFAEGATQSGVGAQPPSDLSLCDFDDDGDLDVFLIASGTDELSEVSMLRVLRNDGVDGYTDVTDSVMPTPDDKDDWRGETIAFGDVAGDVGTPPPDGYPDLVIGSLDDTALPTSRSRVRILANRAGPSDSRRFVDRTDVLMAPVSQYDDWSAEDLWIGDLDGNGGIPDIVATHDEVPEGVSPLTPYFVYYLSGTRVFSFATPQDGGYGAFAWQSRRMPRVIGTQVPTQGMPQCIGGACRDTYTPFRGHSLVVTDFDDDGRRDIAVTSTSALTLNGASVPSTQLARNENILGLDTMVDRSSALNGQVSRLLGDILLTGDVIGDPLEDLVVVRSPGTGTGLAVDIIENRGSAATWSVRTRELMPPVDDDERYQADAAQLVDIDGDGDLDLVLLVVSPPTSGTTTTGLGLRLLRNNGEAGFSRELEVLYPDAPDERWNGTVLATGPLTEDHFGMVLARPNAESDGAEVRTIVRTIDE